MRFILTYEDIKLFNSIVIYGAGSGGIFFYKQIIKYYPKISVKAFCDDNKDGFILNIPIVNTASLEYIEIDAIIIVSSYWQTIYKSIPFSLNKKIFIARDYLYLNDLKLDSFTNKQLFLPSEIKKLNTNIAKISNMFRLDWQKELFSILLKYRTIDKEPKETPISYYQKHLKKVSMPYFDFLNPIEDGWIIEGGMFDGSDTNHFLQIFPKEVKVLGFEPFKSNYEVIKERFRPFLNYRLKLEMKALWSKKTSLWIYGKEHSSDMATVSTNYLDDAKKIEAVNLDYCIKKEDIKKISFLKLDVEGAELEVLIGAINSIKKHRPQLAISIYHSKNDFIEIPLYLQDRLDNYKFFLGHYAGAYNDTVLYAIPN